MLHIQILIFGAISEFVRGILGLSWPMLGISEHLGVVLPVWKKGSRVQFAGRVTFFGGALGFEVEQHVNPDEV